MGFTFYGDLLGVGSYYRLSPHRAYSRLNEFYKLSFEHLRDHCSQNGTKVTMMSDSILIWGDATESILIKLQGLYLRLAKVGLLLRGALVDGCLRFDPRLTVDDFEKMLPRDDTLARAVGLEKSYKGARLLIDNSIAERMLARAREWLTPEGYFHHSADDIPLNSLERRICPTPDSGTYEFLYFWCDSKATDEQINLSALREQLDQMRVMLSSEVRLHYTETLDLIERCESRRKFTERQRSIDDPGPA